MLAYQHLPKYRAKIIGEIDEAAKKFFKAIKAKKRPSPDLYDLVTFRLMKHVIKLTKIYRPRDYGYWEEKGWLDKDYYIDTRINIFKKLCAWLIEKAIRRKFI